MSDTPETDAAVIAAGGDWSPVLRETCRRLERARDELAAMCGRYKQERDEAREQAAVFKDYAQLLGDEIDDMAVFAGVHGWKSSRIEQGKLLRDKIKQLEGAK